MKNKMKNNVVEEIKKSKKSSWFEKIIVYAASAGSFFIGKYLGLMVVLLYIGSIVLGYSLSNWYVKREKVNFKLIKLIAWSNVCAWLLPPLGVFTGISSVNFSSCDTEQKTKFKTLGIVGVTLSLINAISGVIMHLN